MIKHLCAKYVGIRADTMCVIELGKMKHFLFCRNALASTSKHSSHRHTPHICCLYSVTHVSCKQPFWNHPLTQLSARQNRFCYEKCNWCTLSSMVWPTVTNTCLEPTIAHLNDAAASEWGPNAWMRRKEWSRQNEHQMLIHLGLTSWNRIRLENN